MPGQEKTEEQLHFLKILIDAIPSPIYYKNLDWVFEGCNKAFADVFGLAKEDIIGKTSYDISPKELADSYYEMDMELFRRRIVQNFEGKLRYTDGIDHDVIFHKAPYEDIEGRLAGFVGVIIDVTEKKKIELQQILSQKLESIGQLAAGIAHEINTPMQYLGDNTRFLRDGFTDICKLIGAYRHLIASIEENIPAGPLASVRELEKQIDVGFLTAEIPQAIDQSLDGIARLSKLVLAMKDFSHSGAREKALADINRAIEVTATISKNEWKYVADLILDLQPDLPAVNCVIDEINQVVLNMIVNSAQAIAQACSDQGTDGDPGKGRITIKTRSNGDVAQIVISDTGIGIPQSIMHRIFDPFFTTKEVGKGTGQGLAITHDIIVNKHRGSIQVESEVGVGTTFTIQLPLDNSLNQEQ
ncbi:MAG: ATP-binding protein [Thermacetogeniaceae bacterium]|jgi:PAS domain S-box-containing protein